MPKQSRRSIFVRDLIKLVKLREEQIDLAVDALLPVFPILIRNRPESRELLKLAINEGLRTVSRAVEQNSRPGTSCGEEGH